MERGWAALRVKAWEQVLLQGQTGMSVLSPNTAENAAITAAFV